MTQIDKPNLDEQIRSALRIAKHIAETGGDGLEERQVEAIKALIATQVREELTNLKIARLDLGTMTTDHADGYQMAVDDMNRHIDELRAVIGQDNE